MIVGKIRNLRETGLLLKLSMRSQFKSALLNLNCLLTIQRLDLRIKIKIFPSKTLLQIKIFLKWRRKVKVKLKKENSNSPINQ